MIVSFLGVPPGTKLGSITVNPKSRAYIYISWRCLNATAAQTGLRKDECACRVKADGLTKVQFSRESLVFKIAGVSHADPTAAQLRMMGPNDGVFLKPRPSKADQDGAFWCDKPIWLPFRRDDPVNAARELVEQELMFPVRGVNRNNVPLFSDEKRQPFSKRQITTSFNAMLR